MATKYLGVWLKTPDAADALGISAQTLRRRRKDGAFTQGIHYLRTSNSVSAWYLYNIDELIKLFGSLKAPKANGGAK